MQKLLFNNTYDSGTMTFLIVPEKKKYKGVCLEFDLSVETDSMKETTIQIEDYAKVWLKNVVVNKLPEEVLNRPADKRYWKIYKSLVDQDLKRLRAESTGSIKEEIEPTKVARLQSFYPNCAFA